ncbi:hypothetical protein [Methanolobus profundi]|uniref:Archaellin n=1 Tax=Methanolobus profundi TaxID=487685 RepID=A0A1I4RB91_9EURY|nr:hypothetical protein [Methanolobus profundi]SFM49306.1 Archaellin [Methanolobus profundi]
MRIDETEVKKRRIDRRIIIGIALIAIVISMYHFAAPLLENNSFDIKMALSTDSYIVGSKITNFLDAVNEGDTATAYKIYGGSDLLAPSAIALTFSNNGIDPGCIIDVNTTSKEIYKEQAVVATECNVSIRDPYGQVSGSTPIHVYFKLYDTDKGWMITTISFDRPLTIDYNSTDTESLSDDGTAGRLAVKTTSSSLMVKNIEGIRAESVKGEMADTIDLLKLTVGLNVGSDAVDMKDVVISVNHDKNANILIYAGNNENEHMMKGFSTNSASQNLRQLLIEEGNSQKYFVVEKIRDEDASFSLKDPVINSGDLITVYIATVSSTSTGYSYLGSIYIPSLSASGLNIVPRTTVNIVFTPESGSITSTDLTTPSSYGTKETVQLFP